MDPMRLRFLLMRQERSAAACSLPRQDRILVQRCMVVISPSVTGRRKGENRRTGRQWRRLVRGTISWAGMTPCSFLVVIPGAQGSFEVCEQLGRRRCHGRLTVFEELNWSLFGQTRTDSKARWRRQSIFVQCRLSRIEANQYQFLQAAIHWIA